MARISNRAKKIAERYVENLSKKLDIKKALLFGSVARGQANRNSDIDLIILSNEFEKLGLVERLVFLSHLRGTQFLEWPMDIMGYTPKEFDKLTKISSMFAEAKKQGIVLK